MKQIKRFFKDAEMMKTNANNNLWDIRKSNYKLFNEYFTSRIFVCVYFL